MLMLTRVCLSLVLLVTTRVWSQIGVVPFEMPTPTDDTRMQTPPPVSGAAYPTTVGSQARSNYLAAGLTLVGAYDDNVIVGSSTTPVADGIYSILPTIALNQTTLRQTLTLLYSPGFTFYQNTSSLNAANQNAAFVFQYRLSQHTTISLNDSFQKSSNVFDQLPPPSGGAPSGYPQSSQAEVVAPYANRLSNQANAEISYQFSRNGMIGVGGIFTNSNYSNSAEASGLNNSTSVGGLAFYSHRLSSAQYIGVTYEYASSQANPVNVEVNSVNTETNVQAQTVSVFYSIYLSKSLTLSFSGGPQYFSATQTSSARVTSWAPSSRASIGWQRNHTNFVASYSRTISGSSGLSGAFDSSNANASASWQMARTWITGLAAGYSINKNATPSFAVSDSGGHSLSGTVSVQHLMGERLRAEFGYARLHQSYSGVASIATNPDSDRVYISVSYRLSRPLGR
jgi:hypothetical protein